MDATAYLRVSSRSQDIGMQRHVIERAATARGDVITTWYEEKASAKTMKRPELERLRADARIGKMKRVYLYKYDRVCRTGVRDLLNIVEDFRLHGAELVAVADIVDLSGPAAEMILSALAFAARIERAAINDRIASARDRIEAEGGTWGRPRRYVDIDAAKRMKAEGRSVRQISVALKTPRSTVARALAG